MAGPDSASTLVSPWTPSRSEWATLLDGQPNYRIDQIWDGLYRRLTPPSDQTNLPKALRAELASVTAPSLQRVDRQVTPDAMTVKSLWKAADGASVETVLMHYPGRSTVCISSQAGCAMDCGFCATGQIGLQRNLTVGEIVEQVVAAGIDAEAADRRLSNVVFMGMGEPLANYQRVRTALARLIDDIDLGARRITVSTVGLVPQIRRLADEQLQIGLAVSLHAANDELRTRLVPINRRHPIEDLIEACRYYRDRTGRRVSFEWAMMDGVNDSETDADQLAELAQAARSHVNLIPLNPTPGWPTVGSPRDVIDRFVARLEGHGTNVTVRANRGTDIDAACGQLAARREPKAQPVTFGRR